MGIDVNIKAGVLHRKLLPMNIILGEELHYGSFENDYLVTDKVGDGWLNAYHPGHVARGISVYWQEGSVPRWSCGCPSPPPMRRSATFSI